MCLQINIFSQIARRAYFLGLLDVVIVVVVVVVEFVVGILYTTYM